MTQFLRVSQAAAYFHVSTKTIWRWTKDGKLPHTKTMGGHARYDPAVLVKLIEASAVQRSS